MSAIAPIGIYSRAKRRALVVENDVELAPLLDLLLRREYDVTLATDGREAMQLIKRQAPFSLVLLETFLPYQGGFELLQQIRSRAAWEDTCVVLLSNNAGGADGRRARDDGADACLVKPLRPESLLRLLARLAPRRIDLAEQALACA